MLATLRASGCEVILRQRSHRRRVAWSTALTFQVAAVQPSAWARRQRWTSWVRWPRSSRSFRFDLIKRFFIPMQAAMEKVRADKLREVMDGHDGTWIAHPALLPIAMQVRVPAPPLDAVLHALRRSSTHIQGLECSWLRNRAQAAAC